MNASDEKTDRYVTYKNIDCEGNADRLMDMLRRHMEDPEKTNPFWEKFLGALNPPPSESEPRKDNLFLIHCYINMLRDFFEDAEDEEALELLEKIEVECC